jgi:hypothetical protein
MWLGAACGLVCGQDMGGLAFLMMIGTFLPPSSFSSPLKTVPGAKEERKRSTRVAAVGPHAAHAARGWGG